MFHNKQYMKPLPESLRRCLSAAHPVAGAVRQQPVEIPNNQSKPEKQVKHTL
jgi:hypothetical protein